MPLPKVVTDTILFLLALAAIVGFAVIFLVGIHAVWIAPAGGGAPAESDSLTYVATALAALVGGYFAVVLGVKDSGSPHRTGLGGRLSRLRRLAFPGGFANPGRVQLGFGAQQFIGSIYALVYVAVGLTAVVSWLLYAPQTSGLVKNLAVTFIGLVIPAITAYVRG